MKQILTILTFFSFLAFSAAQTSMSFYYVHAIPQGAYQDNLHHQASGIALEFMKDIKQVKNLQLGGLFNVAMYQNEDFEGQTNLSSYRRSYVETNEDDCYYIYQGVARYFPIGSESFFSPFVQLQAGGTTFFSTLSVSDDPEDSFDSQTKHHGTTWLTGLSAGTLIHVVEGISAQLSVGYNVSGNVEYRASPELEEMALYRVSLEDHLVESRVDHVSVQLGFFMAF